MEAFVCNIVGVGSAADPFRPEIADLLDEWSASDARDDPTQGSGDMVVVCDPDVPTRVSILARAGVVRLLNGIEAMVVSREYGRKQADVLDHLRTHSII